MLECKIDESLPSAAIPAEGIDKRGRSRVIDLHLNA
jgi:hypothetical protein